MRCFENIRFWKQLYLRSIGFLNSWIYSIRFNFLFKILTERRMHVPQKNQTLIFLDFFRNLGKWRFYKKLFQLSFKPSNFVQKTESQSSKIENFKVKWIISVDMFAFVPIEYPLSISIRTQNLTLMITTKRPWLFNLLNLLIF